MIGKAINEIHNFYIIRDEKRRIHDKNFNFIIEPRHEIPTMWYANPQTCNVIRDFASRLNIL